MSSESRNPYSAPLEASPEPGSPFAAAPRGVAWLFLDREWRLRTVYRFLLFFLVVFGVQVAIGVGSVIVLAVFVAAANQGEVSPELLMEHLEQNSTWVMILAAPPGALLTLAAMCVFRLWLDRRSLRSAGFKMPGVGALLGLFLAFLLGAGAIEAAALIVWSLGGMEFAPAGHVGWQWAALTGVLVFAAFLEEIIFRAYLLQNWRDIGMPALGVIASSILFWLVHSANPHAWSSVWVGINLFGAGVVLSLAYIAAENIWFPSVLHFAWNFAQGPLLGIPVSGVRMESLWRMAPTPASPEWLSGGDFGLEASALCTLSNVVLSVLLGAAIWRRRARRQAAVGVSPFQA